VIYIFKNLGIIADVTEKSYNVLQLECQRGKLGSVTFNPYVV